MRVLVSGGAGFIGSQLVDLLASEGDEPVVVDIAAPPAEGADTPWRTDGVEVHCCDVRDYFSWSLLLPACDAVCHLAARVGLGVDFGDTAGYVSNNDVGTSAMLCAMHDLGWRGRLVLSSSMVVYGDGAYVCPQHGMVRPTPRSTHDLDAGRFEPPCPRCGHDLRPELVREDHPVDPRNVYAATKLHQEHLCAIFGREHGIPVTSLRYHNVYGPGMPRDTPYSGVAAIFRSQVERGEAPAVFEDGGQLRDFIHVSDVARANLLALRARHPFDGPLNIASGRPIALHRMAETLARAHGCPGHPLVTGRYRLGDVRHIAADPSAAAAAIGFVASVQPEEGLRRFAHEPLR